ncbi:hypothetical protein GCM10020331_094670 [Ectobacillus funiculus]
MLQETDYEKNGLVMVEQAKAFGKKDAAIKLIRRGGFETTVDHILFANGGSKCDCCHTGKSL